jgi:hypothetical protein
MLQGRGNKIKPKTRRVKSAQMDLPGSENSRKRGFQDGKNKEYQ